jgi:predicted RNA-binding Zn-ribbon protein involved in translation (DUF1610 family)
MDQLDHLFQRVVGAARDAKPELLARAFEVAELIELVPYRAVRAEGAMETNDDYAHALTRLLAGERGYVFADDLLQDDLRAELASPNPDLGAYRAYLTSRITLSQEHVRALTGSMPVPAVEVPPAAPAAPAPASVRPAALMAKPLAEAVTAPKPVRPSAMAASSPPRPLDPSAETAPRSSRPGCRYCGQALPEDRLVHFCPSCGQNLLARLCPACSAELESGWKFCVACGRLASS